jgi:hypothetical protein
LSRVRDAVNTVDCIYSEEPELAEPLGQEYLLGHKTHVQKRTLLAGWRTRSICSEVGSAS